MYISVFVLKWLMALSVPATAYAVYDDYQDDQEVRIETCKELWSKGAINHKTYQECIK